MKTKKTIGVIGAGLSGLVTVKELLEAGHTVHCFEKSGGVGGVFSNEETYDSLLLTVSNYFMAYSDFVPTEERLRFWTKEEYRQYLEKYVEHFGFKDNIQFNSNVLSVDKENDKWKVVVEEGEESAHYFDSVAVCSGQFQKKKMPQLQGMDSFGGDVLHSTDYRNADEFKGKKVLCIGLGESSADITAEIGDVAEKTILSLRRRQFIAPRFIGIHGPNAFDPKSYTIDTISTRFMHQLPKNIHAKVIKKRFGTFTKSFNPSTRLHGEWNLSAGPESAQVVTKNERIFDALTDNKVEANIGGIKEITTNSVIFNDGSEHEIDTIMCCTGFEFTVPTIDLPIDSPRSLYKQMFHPDLGDSLAFIGFARPQQGGVPAIAELQARYFSLICSGEKTLPEKAELLRVIKDDKEFWESEFSITPHIQALVNYVYYTDDMARKIGCDLKVSPWADPQLYFTCMYGPQWGVQYRLRGPGAKPDFARKVIMEKLPVPMKFRFAMLSVLSSLVSLLPLGENFRPRNRAKYVGIDC